MNGSAAMIYLVWMAMFLGTAASAAVDDGGTRTMESNLRFRLTWGDLGRPGEIVPGQPESKRALRVAEGGERLLELCRDNPESWQQDPLLFRFGHRHPWSTIGCSENEVHRGLVRSDPSADERVPDPSYNMGAHARQYMHDAFGPGAVAMALGAAAASPTMQITSGWSGDNRTYLDRVGMNLARNVTLQSIEFGTAAFLRQDEKFRPSGERGFRRRTRAALYRTFFVPGRDGDELAFPRIAAALGTPWVMQPLHPGLKAAPNPWEQSGFLLGRYVLRSLWAEFRPEIRRFIRWL